MWVATASQRTSLCVSHMMESGGFTLSACWPIMPSVQLCLTHEHEQESEHQQEEGLTRSHRSMQASISTVMPLSSGSLNAPAELAIRIELAAGHDKIAGCV
jgi:hypothetical protein